LPERDYLLPYSEDARKRHYHRTERGQVVAFAVQLEVRVQDAWKPAIRYDCAHDFSHRDRYNLAGIQRKEALALPFDEALTFADEDLNASWQRYRARFLAGEFP